MEFSTWDIVRNLLFATRWTLLLSAVALLGGGAAAFLILLMQLSTRRLLRVAARGYVLFFQGTPLLMQLFLTYFGLSALGFDVPAWLSAGLALVVWTSAFLSEVWRGSIDAIDRGQWEGSASLGLRPLQQLWLIIIPQAVVIAVPATVGFSVQVIKATALASIIGFVELSRTGAVIANATYQPLTTYGTVALIYFALCWPLSKGSRLLERKLHAADRT